MNLQNIIRAISGTAAIVIVGVAVKDSIQTTKTERRKREEIKLDSERQILAIRRASKVVQEKILRGDYDDDIFNAIPNIIADQKFYQMIDRIDD